jgi:acyl-coenzyme A synthetase/AMP-(fatty) acid ligase
MGSERDGKSHEHLIYSPDWKSWEDPGFPEYFSPTSYILDKHLGTAVADKPGFIVDDDAYTYSALLAEVCRCAHGLVALGLRPGERLLLFGTNSLEYVACWLGAIRAGIIPIVVSDLYKAPSLLYFLQDTAAHALFIDEEQLAKLDEVAKDLPAALTTLIVRGSTGEAEFFESADRTVSDYQSVFHRNPQIRSAAK